MRFLSTTVALAATALLLPAPSRAQSLTEAAAKEKERRKGTTARTFTEDDLRRAGATRQRENPTPADGTAAVPADAATAAKDGKAGKEPPPKAKTEDEVRAEQEKAWRERLTKANDDVTRLTGEIDRMQRDLNDMSQNLYGSSRATRVSRLEDTKRQLATAQQSVADLQEEGRRSSYRP